MTTALYRKITTTTSTNSPTSFYSAPSHRTKPGKTTTTTKRQTGTRHNTKNDSVQSVRSTFRNSNNTNNNANNTANNNDLWVALEEDLGGGCDILTLLQITTKLRSELSRDRSNGRLTTKDARLTAPLLNEMLDLGRGRWVDHSAVRKNVRSGEGDAGGWRRERWWRWEELGVLRRGGVDLVVAEQE